MRRVVEELGDEQAAVLLAARPRAPGVEMMTGGEGGEGTESGEERASEAAEPGEARGSTAPQREGEAAKGGGVDDAGEPQGDAGAPGERRVLTRKELDKLSWCARAAPRRTPGPASAAEPRSPEDMAPWPLRGAERGAGERLPCGPVQGLGDCGAPRSISPAALLTWRGVCVAQVGA